MLTIQKHFLLLGPGSLESVIAELQSSCFSFNWNRVMSVCF